MASTAKLVVFNRINHNKVIVPDTNPVHVVDQTTSLPRRDAIVVYNVSTVTVYIGNSNVSVDNGFPMPPKSSISLALGAELKLYAISQSGNAELRFLEGG